MLQWPTQRLAAQENFAQLFAMPNPKNLTGAPDEPSNRKLQEQTGQRLRLIREFAGADQEDMRAVCGASQSQWSKWERGEQLPNVFQMARFAARAKTSLDLIYRGRLIDTHSALAFLLRSIAPDLVVEPPTGMDESKDTALASYRAATNFRRYRSAAE